MATVPHGGAKKHHAYVEKTLNGVAVLLEESLLTEKYAKKEGLLQSLEPGFKLPSILLLIVITSLLTSIWVVALVYLITLAMAWRSLIPLGFFIKRVWIFIPLFAGLIVLPSIFSVITPGEPLLWIGKGIYISKPGVAGAVLLILRVAASVSLAVLLVLTTPWQEVLGALRVFRIPLIFVMTLAMTYRYIFLLLRLIQDYYTAKRSRQIVPEGPGRGQSFVAGRIGALFMKSLALSNHVHSAMLARGYTGEVRTLGTNEPRAMDYLWLGGTFLLSLGLVWLDVGQGVV